MKKSKVIAIFTADWHLSHKPPVWRSNEPDWYEAMSRPIDEIGILSAKYGCPIFLAGDIFDKWSCTSEIINFAMKHMSSIGEIYAIPGQHDVPNHNIQELYRSAFASLLLSDTIEYKLEMLFDRENIRLKCFPYGKKIGPTKLYATTNVALVHDYVWIPKHAYPHAPAQKRLMNNRYPQNHMRKDRYYGYDVVVFGDNHSGFLTRIGNTTIFNCGTLMRRKSDEEDYRPQVGLFYSDGHIETHYLDISQDKHLDSVEAKKLEKQELDMRKFAKELAKLGTSALDFSEAVKQYCKRNKISKEIQHLMDKAMEE